MARRLAAIMFTDIVGYSALSHDDEPGALQLLQEQERLVRPLLELHHGRKVKSMGDGLLLEFPNALDAVECAVELQRRVHERAVAGDARPFRIRVGIHLGDVQRHGADILGDAVNIAARLEPLAEPGGICLSEQLFAQVRHRAAYHFSGLGPRTLKGIREPVIIYRVLLPWMTSESAPEPGIPRRLAVLPLTNISPDPGDEYFSEGLTEELISTISKVRGLSVTSRTSVMQYKNQTKHVSQIGEELGVDSILEGSVRKAGGQVRVAVQLIDTKGDRHLWAENYDRNLDDIFEVQSAIAGQVADALRVEILSPEKERIDTKPTESVAAYTLYLKGVDQRSRWNAEGYEKAIEFFTRAGEEDPTFALAFAKTAECYVLIADVGLPSVEAIAKAKEYASQALSLNDSLAEAWYARALIADQYDWDWGTADASFRRAMSLNPSLAEVHDYYAWFLAMMGRFEEAVSEADKACELDPLSPVTLQLSGLIDWIAGEYARASTLLRRAIELAPGYAPAHADLGLVYAAVGNFEEAVQEAEESVKLSDQASTRERQIQVYAMAGRKERAREVLDLLLSKRFLGALSPSHVGSTYYLLGEKDLGWEWMQKAFDARDTGLAAFNKGPVVKAAREDPRFLDLLKRIGLD